MSDIANHHRGSYDSSCFSVIGEGVVFRGDVEFEGVLHISGDFFGNIKGDGDLGIGLTGRVRSIIHANNILISGLVCGNVFALGRVGIKSSAIVIGNIQAASLVVEEGSILHGKLEILKKETHGNVAKLGLISYRKAAASNEKVLLTPLPAVQPPLEPGKTEVDDPVEIGSKVEEQKFGEAEATGPENRKGKYSVWN